MQNCYSLRGVCLVSEEIWIGFYFVSRTWKVSHYEGVTLFRGLRWDFRTKS